jgi:hypothetical protein
MPSVTEVKQPGQFTRRGRIILRAAPGARTGNWSTSPRTQLSSGPARAAIQHSGLPATRGALTRVFAGSRKPDGTYRQANVFRYLVART